MRLQEASDELKRLSCGRALGSSREDTEDGGLIVYLDYEGGMTLTVLLPLSIQDQPEDERKNTVMSATTWMIHEGMGDA